MRNIKDLLKDIDVKSLIIILLLITICYMQYNNNRQINNIINNKHTLITTSRKDFDKFQRNFFENLDSEIEEIKRARDRIQRESEDFFGHFNGTLFENNKNFNNKKFVFHTKTNLNEKNNEFIVRVNVPRNFTMDDIKIEFKDSILGIKAEKTINNEDSKQKSKYYNSFFESFTVAETKAEYKDLKITLDKGILTVIVPIIK